MSSPGRLWRTLSISSTKRRSRIRCAAGFADGLLSGLTIRALYDGTPEVSAVRTAKRAEIERMSQCWGEGHEVMTVETGRKGLTSADANAASAGRELQGNYWETPELGGAVICFWLISLTFSRRSSACFSSA